MEYNTKVTLGTLELENPILTASGCYGYGLEFVPYSPFHTFGAIVLKSITQEKREGNPPPRVKETYGGLINSIGLENPGIDGFMEKTLPMVKKQIQTPVFASIAGFQKEEYIFVLEKMIQDPYIQAIEFNFSCPNIHDKGVTMDEDPEVITWILQETKKRFSGFISAKLGMKTKGIGTLAKYCEDAGADAVTLINTIPSLDISIETKKLFLGFGSGGLSGPAMKNIAMKAVYDAYPHLKIPIIASGGVTSAEDIIKYMMLGATAVQVGTYLLTKPNAIFELKDGLIEYMEKNSCSDLKSLIGVAHL